MMMHYPEIYPTYHTVNKTNKLCQIVQETDTFPSNFIRENKIKILTLYSDGPDYKLYMK